MSDIEEKDFIEIMLDLFKGREDCFSQQLAKTIENEKITKVKYRPIKRAMSYIDMDNHLNFRKTYGMYLITGNEGCYCFCIDLDYSENRLLSLMIEYGNKAEKMMMEKIKEDAKKQYEYVKSFGLNVFVEFSGSKGYHIWGFFEDEIPLDYVKQLGDKITITRNPLVVKESELKTDENGNTYTDEKYEFYPKQESMEGKTIGSIIKIPLGKHIKTKLACNFVDPETFKPFMDQESYVKDIYFNKKIKTSELEQIIGKIEFNIENKLSIVKNIRKTLKSKKIEIEIDETDDKSTNEITKLFLSPYDKQKNIIPENIKLCPPCIHQCYVKSKELSGQFLTRIILTHYLSSKKYDVNDVARFFKYEINDKDDNKNPKLLNYYVNWAYGDRNSPYILENCNKIQREGLCPNIINKIKKDDIYEIKKIDEEIRNIIKDFIATSKESEFFLEDFKENRNEYTINTIEKIIIEYNNERKEKKFEIDKLFLKKEKICGKLICTRTINPLSHQFELPNLKSIDDIKKIIIEEKEKEKKKINESTEEQDPILELNRIIAKTNQTTIDNPEYEKKKFIKGLNSNDAKNIFKKIESYIENNSHILVVKIPPAVGKTYLTGNACFFNKNRSYIFFASSHPLLDDMNKNIKKANDIALSEPDFFFHIYGKGQHEMCINERGLNFIRQYGHSTVFCNKCEFKEDGTCPYYNMINELIENKDLSWAGHFNHYFTLYDILRKKYSNYDKDKIIIFDEEFLGNFFATEEICTEQITEYIANISNIEIRNIFEIIFECMEEKHKLYLERNKKINEDEILDIKKRKDDEDAENTIFYHKIINIVSQINLESINAEELEYDEKIYQKFETLTPLKYKNPCLFLKEFYEYRKNSSNRKNIISFVNKGETICISYSRFIYEAKDVIILNATCDEEIIKKLVIHGEFEKIEMDVKFQPNQKIYQISPHKPLDNSLTFSEIFDKNKNRNIFGLRRYYQKKSKTITKNFIDDVNSIKKIIQSNYIKCKLIEPKFLIICRKTIEDFMNEEMKELKKEKYVIDVIHYNGKENMGVNKFEDYNVVILFGSLCISSYDIVKKADILDIPYASILKTMREARMIQGLHRIRPFKPIKNENGQITYKNCFIFILTSLNLNLEFIDQKKSYKTGSLNLITKKMEKMNKEKKEDVEFLTSSLKILSQVKNKGFVTISEINNIIPSTIRKESKFEIITELTKLNIIKWNSTYNKLIPSINFEKELNDLSSTI